MKILFIGDIVGKIGRRMIKEKVPYYVDKYGIDFVIANGENATHGKGLNFNHYQELIDDGVDVLTMGNHYASKKEIASYIDNVDRLIRPINIVNPIGGVGSEVYEVDGITIRVTNLMGSAFITDVTVSDPYYALADLLSDEENEKATINIVDLHAEATGEKLSLAYEFDGKVSAILGTHTHIQTHDARILPEGTGYITDVGMCGYADGVLGVETKSATEKTLFGNKSRFVYPDEGRGMFNAVVLDIDNITGKTKEIFPIYFFEP